MAKDTSIGMAGWMKFILGLVVLGGLVYKSGQVNSSHGERISHTEDAVVILAEADKELAATDKENIAKLEAHKLVNLATEKEQNKKHEAIVESQHQYEIMVQRQLTVSESLLRNAEEAKTELKEIRKSQSELVKSQIKLEAELSKWEPTE